ncbi:single insulin-like growth factor-binding domain protein-1 isoform X5 [Penaeus monodon]|uniref:single insulin-like growth factor-binding domain protein-1 isoform X5 n=1 Tax=Penaeus monodon TaxID=6687 RepID=UPI0018A71C2A|nr:single insulin-like growth factor-binding domain protein-1 isoform X5 [Penaeus monodon]
MRASLVLLAGVVLIALVCRTEAHKCEDCSTVSCPSTADCTHGTQREHCNCCDVCLRAAGEKCDGHEHMDGICIEPLKCKKNICT